MSGRPVRVLAGTAVAGALHAALNAVLLRRPPPFPAPVRRPVTVVLPVRDEEAQVGGCLAAVLAQQGVPDLRVVVVDDGSTDGTAAVVRAVDDPRVRLVTAPDPPPGWLGKPHACAVGAAAGGEDHDAVLVFLDADVRLFPDAVAGSVAVLEAHDLDLVSPWPRPVTGTGAERLVQPLGPWLWMTTLPVRLAERSPRPSLAAANGQFLVVRRTAYERAGGHGAVRSEVIEDVALARAVKRAGGRAAPVDGSRLAACRMYAGWPALRAGYAKSLWASVGGSPAASAVAAAGLTAVAVLPALAALRGSRAGLVGYAAGVAGRAVSAAVTGSRVWPDALAHPVSVLLFDVLMASSLADRRRGRLTWRGRALPSIPAAGPPDRRAARGSPRRHTGAGPTTSPAGRGLR
ncbi:glycosyltransferase [Geodermatophilus sp. SYSU D00965]